MIQLLDLMILMVGMYIITRMSIYLFRRDSFVYTGLLDAINKTLAIITIFITIACMLLAILSFVDTLDIPSLERQLR